MTIGQKQLYINGITWHCISIFYAKKKIANLLNAINDFCKNHKERIKHFSFYFSNDQGEHINLVFIPEQVEALNPTFLPSEIEEYFKQFLTKNPSEIPYPIPYGSFLWLPYPNNSLVWNVFPIPHFLSKSQAVRDFAQVTSRLIINLYDAESSYEDNVVSIAMLLFVKIWKKQNIALPSNTDTELSETLQSYWEYEEDELMTQWLQGSNITWEYDEDDMLINWLKYDNITASTFVFCTQLDLPENIFISILESDKKQ